MTKCIRLSNLKINICFKSEDSRVHSEICIIYSSKNSKFTVKTPSQCIYLFKDTRLDMGLTCLHILTLKVTQLHACDYKVTILDF